MQKYSLFIPEFIIDMKSVPMIQQNFYIQIRKVEFAENCNDEVYNCFLKI